MDMDEFMAHALHFGSAGNHLNIGEASGWATLTLSFLGLAKSGGALIGAITPDLVNPWLILVGSAVTGAIAVGSLAYSRIIRARLDGQQLEEIFAANRAAIRAGLPVPFPTFMPRGSVTVTTTTKVDVNDKLKGGE